MILFSYSIEASQHSDPFLWNIALLSKAVFSCHVYFEPIPSQKPSKVH